VKINNITLLVVSIVLLAMQSSAYCDTGLSYAETVKLIKSTMEDSPSEYRKESYGAIKFDGCRLDYSVAGTYPVGEKTGNDYTPFIILSFENYFDSRDGYQELQLRNLVVNLASEEKAAVLVKAFLRLGELCRTHGMAVVHNKQ